MNWPYHFLDLTQEEKDRRRTLLDTYGSRAQLSVLAPLLALQIYFLVSWLSIRWRSRNGGIGYGGRVDSPPSSPRSKKLRSSSLFGASRTGGDYLHLTKRFGIVASSQLPLQYLLALKSPYSPLQYLTRRSHETLNSLHQLLGRITTLLLYSHAILYLNFYILSNLLTAKLQEGYVLAGIFGIVAFTAVGTAALTPVRRWSYKVFYITHVTLAIALLPVLWFHVSHIRIYLYETAAVYALNTALRFLASSTRAASMRVIPGTNLLEIEVPLTSASRQKWAPGQHAYISLAGHPLLRTFRSNPFTVASIPTSDGHLRFMARILDGNTAKLATQAGHDSKREHLITVEGPYGVVTHAERLLRYDRVLFIAGGVGATFIVPLYRQLLADLSPSAGSRRRGMANFLWMVRSRAETAWALPAQKRERQGFVERLRVQVTGSKAVNEESLGASEGREGMEDTGYDHAEQGIELEEQKNLLADEGHEDTKSDMQGLKVFEGRPDLTKAIEQTLSSGHGSDKVAVVVCSPGSLSRAVRNEVGLWVGRGRDVWFWDESFGY
ncbi:hypothetical protein LTR62_002145 [Meristemomyces frigidus]|uniref:ferric-chelate reductase (NADPH) n=1 Tax=Meristemomyces frigidus TaxID=1508187 RepID=A0AAN7T8S7_9PEZI|nr:hypothetical protein LTR62_002145 [Meristemomyces frigidus]